MKKLILILALIVGFADTALAETWLCISEAAATVTKSAPFGSGSVSPVGAKYLVTLYEASNRVEVKPFGKNSWVLDCKNTLLSIQCVLPDDDTGLEFNFDKQSSTFWGLGITKDLDTERMMIFVESGNCSTI